MPCNIYPACQHKLRPLASIVVCHMWSPFWPGGVLVRTLLHYQHRLFGPLSPCVFPVVTSGDVVGALWLGGCSVVCRLVVVLALDWHTAPHWLASGWASLTGQAGPPGRTCPAPVPVRRPHLAVQAGPFEATVPTSLGRQLD